MTNVAIARRTDDLGRGAPPRTAAELSKATGGKAETENALTSALTAVATYIPTEVIALYLAALAAVRSGPRPEAASRGIARDLAEGAAMLARPSGPEVKTVIVFTVITPVTVWLLYAARAKTANKALPWRYQHWPVWEMFAATAAFVAWAFAFPDSPFARFSWYNLAWATFAVLSVSTVLGLIAPILQRPLKA